MFWHETKLSVKNAPSTNNNINFDKQSDCAFSRRQLLKQLKKAKSLQNKLSKIESQIKQLEIDIQHDDKALESNYDKHIEDASFFTAYNKKKSDLDKLLDDWEEVQGELDAMNS